jgi:hypothetical protein
VVRQRRLLPWLLLLLLLLPTQPIMPPSTHLSFMSLSVSRPPS